MEKREENPSDSDLSQETLDTLERINREIIELHQLIQNYATAEGRSLDIVAGELHAMEEQQQATRRIFLDAHEKARQIMEAFQGLKASLSKASATIGNSSQS